MVDVNGSSVRVRKKPLDVDIECLTVFSVVCTGLEPGLAALRLLGQVRYSRDPRLGAAVSLLSSPRFRLA